MQINTYVKKKNKEFSSLESVLGEVKTDLIYAPTIQLSSLIILISGKVSEIIYIYLNLR